VKQSSKAYGDASEDLACRFLQQEGFVIVERNYFARKLGEIDIIATKEGIWHFVEVKSAKADFEPLYNISTSKLAKVINATHYYMKIKNLDVAFTIDALILRLDEVEFIENITL